MADVTLKHFDELDNHDGMFLYARKGLGVTAWGMNVERLPANWDEYPEHEHTKDGQEEVYVPLEGSATLHCAGETWNLEPGTLTRVGPGEKRKIVPGDDGITMLVIGGTPGQAYTPES